MKQKIDIIRKVQSVMFLNGVVVLGELGEFLFDVDSNLARTFGEILS